MVEQSKKKMIIRIYVALLVVTLFIAVAFNNYNAPSVHNGHIIIEWYRGILDILQFIMSVLFTVLFTGGYFYLLYLIWKWFKKYILKLE